MRRDDAEKALQLKGFQEEKREHSHRYYRLFVNGEKTRIFTRVSTGTGNRDIGNGNIQAMAQQLKIVQKEFKELVSCTLSGEQYLELLRTRRHL